MYDVGTRFYDPGVGRFSTRDVLFGDPMTPVSLNQFVYGYQNPIRYNDPTGMVPADSTGGSCVTRKCATKTKELEEDPIVLATTPASSSVSTNTNTKQAQKAFTPPKPRPPAPPSVSTPRIGLDSLPSFAGGAGASRLWGLFREGNKHLVVRPRSQQFGRPGFHWNNHGNRIEWDKDKGWHYNDDAADPEDHARSVQRGVWEAAKHAFVSLGRMGEIFIVPPVPGSFVCDMVGCDEEPTYQEWA